VGNAEKTSLWSRSEKYLKMFSVYVTVEKYILLKLTSVWRGLSIIWKFHSFSAKCLYGGCRKSGQVWVECKLVRLVEDQCHSGK